MYLGCPTELEIDFQIAVVVEAVDKQRRQARLNADRGN